MKKSANITKIITKYLPPLITAVVIIVVWHMLSHSDVMPSFMMPSPAKVWNALINDWSIILMHAKTTLAEALTGLGIGIVISFVIAILMDCYRPVHNALYPLLIVSQTIPSIAIAPLLLLWFGYDMTPKIILIVITTFFPITIGLLDGFKAADPDALGLLKSMGAGPVRRFIHIKLPYSLGYFFAGLKISVTYAIVGAVISEWLGGTSGLGVYMTRCRKSFAYDRMFAIIIFIAVLSILLLLAVQLIKWLCMPWERKRKTNEK